jgi:hypothetical protein
MMIQFRMAMMMAALCLSAVAAPANAQFYWKPTDFSGAPLVGLEPGIAPAMPGATLTERKAAIAWNVRSGLNLAALQCAFEPLLRTTDNYNYLLSDHSAELAAAFATLGGYFKRTTKTARAAQDALDRYGTRTISGFSTVSAQLGFCQAAGHVGRRGLFTPKGSFTIFAMTYLRELRNSLKYSGEQQFSLYVWPIPQVPSLDPACWDRKGRYTGKCG